MPPEVYIRLLATASQGQKPKFRSSIFPIKNEVSRMSSKKHKYKKEQSGVVEEDSFAT
jgi:hypothetical protein